MQNEFEKRVQEQLAGFSINPSEDVWLHVEKNILKEKRKKRLVAFWWTAAILLVAGGGLTWYVMNGEKHKALTSNRIEINTKGNLAKTQNATNDEIKQVSGTRRQNNNTGTATNHDLNTNNEALTGQTQALKNKNSATDNIEGSQQNNGTPQNVNASEGSAKVLLSNSKTGNFKKASGKEIAYNKPIAHSEVVSPGITVRSSVSNQNKKESNDGNKDVAKQDVPVNNDHKETELLPGAKVAVPAEEAKLTRPDDKLIAKEADSITTSLLTKEISAPKKDSTAATISIKNKADKKPISSKWKFGLYVSAGFADNVSKLPLGENKLLNDAAYSTPSTSTGNTAALPAVQLTYAKGFGGAIGAFAHRQVSQKLGLSTGLNFQYYSTKTTTGSKVNNERIVYDTLTGNSSLVKEYFVPLDRSQANFSQGTSTFTNHYYFLQMPVDLTYLFNRNKPQAGMFSIGLTPGILLGSTALYYNRLDRITYVDRQQFKKFQLSAQAGVSFGLISSKKYMLQAGPYFMAGLTNLSKPVYNSNQHLVYTGISTKVTFK